MPEGLADALRGGLRLWSIGMSAEDDGAARAAFEEMVSGYHEDAELDFSRTLPDFTPIRGREAMVAWSMSAREAFKGGVELEPGELLVAGDAVVFPVRLTTQGAASGLAMQAEFAYVFTFRAQKIASATTYQTVPEALQAVSDRHRPEPRPDSRPPPSGRGGFRSAQNRRKMPTSPQARLRNRT